MDVISLGKAKKVKKANDALDVRMGIGVKGSAADVASRVSLVEEADPKAGLVERIGKVSAHTAINLNKHNLQMNTYLNKGHTEHKEMVFDDFSDASGIDEVKSTGILHDTVSKTVKLQDGALSGELVLTAESSEDIPMLATVSMASNGSTTDKMSGPLEGGQLTGTTLLDGALSLSVIEAEVLEKEGTFESDVIDMGENFKTLSRLEATSVQSGETSIDWFTATSNDGVVFEEYLPLNTDGTIASTNHKFIKVKAVLRAEGVLVPRLVHDFTAEEASQFESNEYVTFDGALKLKTKYEQQMVVDETFVGEGTLLKAVIDKSKFKTIERVEAR
ncbi:hypothetical protein ACQR3P_29480 [Rhodococcus sp. IEGM1300]